MADKKFRDNVNAIPKEQLKTVLASLEKTKKDMDDMTKKSQSKLKDAIDNQMKSLAKTLSPESYEKMRERIGTVGNKKVIRTIERLVDQIAVVRERIVKGE